MVGWFFYLFIFKERPDGPVWRSSHICQGKLSASRSPCRPPGEAPLSRWRVGSRGRKTYGSGKCGKPGGIFPFLPSLQSHFLRRSCAGEGKERELGGSARCVSLCPSNQAALPAGEGLPLSPRVGRQVGNRAAPAVSRVCRALPGALSSALGQAGSCARCITSNPSELNRTSPRDKTDQIFP